MSAIGRAHYCVLDLDGDVVAEGAVKTTEASFRVLFEGKGRMRIALEAGTHSPWISRLLIALGHEVLVANPRKLRLIAESDAKHDRADARLLARLAHVGPALLSPIHARSAQTQIDLAVIRAREVAVQTRTKIVNAVRGMVKSTGHRLPASPTLTFARKATEGCPEALQPALLPLDPPGPDVDRRHCGVRPIGGGESARVSRDPGHSDHSRRRRADGRGLRAGAEQ